MQLFAQLAEPRFTTAGVVVVAALAGYVCIYRPIRGVYRYRRLEAIRQADSDALVNHARRFIGQWWLVAAIVATVPIVSPDVSWGDLGLVWPREINGWAYTVGVVLALVIAHRRVRNILAKGGKLPDRSATAALHPRTARERRAMVAMAITAGFCEELFFRGLLIAATVGVMGVEPLLGGLIAAVVFGIAHAYQGPKGVLRTGWFGVLAGGLYAVTGSLLAPVLFHAGNDLIAFLAFPRVGTNANPKAVTVARQDTGPRP